MRSIENLELNRNLLHSAEMQINKTCNSRFKKLLKRIYVLQFSTIGAIRWGGAYLSEVEVDYTLLICIAVAVLTEIQSSEFASFLNLKRIRRQHKTAIKTRRNTLRNAARDLSNHNGVVMSPSEATIEIRSARARVSQIESTLVRDIIGLGDNHMGSPEWSGVGSFIYVVVLIGFLAGYLITGEVVLRLSSRLGHIFRFRLWRSYRIVCLTVNRRRFQLRNAHEEFYFVFFVNLTRKTGFREGLIWPFN